MKIKYVYLAFASIVLFASCKKFLDQKPDSQATDETTWQSESDANASVAACYSLLRSAFNASITYYCYGDLPSDEFSEIAIGEYEQIRSMTWNVSIPYANIYDPRIKLRVYSNFYAAIAQSNRCLHFISDMPASVFAGDDDAAKTARKNKFLGEAYFMRAFNYFYISRVWGDVPLATNYYADISNEPALPRSPQSQVLAQAISDAKMAKTYLNWKDNSSADKVVRADKGAAFALLAHIYAWKGNYDSCAMACDSVLNSGTYSLTSPSTYMSIYKGQSSEGIFEIAANNSLESQNAIDGYSTYTGATLTPPYLPNGPQQPLWTINPATIATLFTDSSDIRFQNAFVKLIGTGNDVYECIKFANIQSVNNNSTYQIALNNTYVFRLADIELLKAEAMAAQSSPNPAEALFLLNDLRAHRGINTPLTGLVGPDLIKEVINERGRELFMEGHRFYDLIRLERLTGEAQINTMTHADFLKGKYYMPVDPTMFLTNSKLTQTPFWIGKLK